MCWLFWGISYCLSPWKHPMSRIHSKNYLAYKDKENMTHLKRKNKQWKLTSEWLSNIHHILSHCYMITKLQNGFRKPLWNICIKGPIANRMSLYFSSLKRDRSLFNFLKHLSPKAEWWFCDWGGGGITIKWYDRSFKG